MVTTRRESWGAAYGRLGKFTLHYPSNTEVKAPDWSMGIAVFDTKKQAESYRSGCADTGTIMIIRVTPTSRGKRPKRVLRLGYCFLHEVEKEIIFGALRYGEMFVNHTEQDFWPVPKGTICYPSVYVID